MRIHIYTLVLLTVLTGAELRAQELFAFNIKDRTSLEPIKFCYVIVKGKNISSVSDENGLIKIKADVKDTLVIYQVGYLLKKTTPELVGPGNNVWLHRKDVNLEEVSITAKTIEIFNEKEYTVFLDFEFYDDHVLSLISRGSKYDALLLSDKNGNKITEIRLKIKAEGLFKDCLNNIHLLTKDSIYQIYYDYQTIHLLPAYDLVAYNNMLKRCECSHNDKYIFKTSRYQELKNIYTYYDAPNGSSKQLALVADSQNIKDFNMDFDIRYFLDLRRRGAGYFYTVADIYKYMDQFREQLVLDDSYKRLLKPVDSEVKIIDSSFALFDYTHKTVSYYSFDGQLQSQASLEQFPQIAPKILIDRDAPNYVFTKQNNRNGLLTLYRFDKLTNQITHSFILNDFHYLGNFQIKENYLYFINSDMSRNDINTKIVKVWLDWKKMAQVTKAD
ncbi:MAG: hypothetical protein JNL60_03780 [Bacteroidia bacterium]|nr:hypothetical protein [Bacteroidia bacterium]